MFGNIGIGEILIVLLVALFLFGAGRLPEIGRAIGKGIKEFKKAITEEEENTKDKK